jgi:hypothetical protein
LFDTQQHRGNSSLSLRFETPAYVTTQSQLRSRQFVFRRQRQRTGDLSDCREQGAQISTGPMISAVEPAADGASDGHIWGSPTRSCDGKQKYSTDWGTTTHPRCNSTLFTLIKNSIKRHIRFVGFLKRDAYIISSPYISITS